MKKINVVLYILFGVMLCVVIYLGYTIVKNKDGLKDKLVEAEFIEDNKVIDKDKMYTEVSKQYDKDTAETMVSEKVVYESETKVSYQTFLDNPTIFYNSIQEEYFQDLSTEEVKALIKSLIDDIIEYPSKKTKNKYFSFKSAKNGDTVEYIFNNGKLKFKEPVLFTKDIEDSQLLSTFLMLSEDESYSFYFTYYDKKLQNGKYPVKEFGIYEIIDDET